MRTRDDVWRWIWDDDDDDVLDPLARAILDLAPEPEEAPQPPPPSPEMEEPEPEPEPPPEPELPEPELPQPVLPQPEPDAEAESPPEAELAPEPESPPRPEASAEEAPAPSLDRHRLGRSRTLSRVAWFAALAGVAVLVGTIAPHVFPRDAERRAAPPPAPDPGIQQVVAWTVRSDRVDTASFVTVLAAGGRPPVALAIPGDVTINVPGQGLGTMAEAASSGDAGLASVAVENLLGIPVDSSTVTPMADFRAALDAVGGIVVDDQTMDGGAVTAYLTARALEANEPERFLRWQDVLEGLLTKVEEGPGALVVWPEEARAVVQPSMDLLSLPVIDVGAGLYRPDDEALNELVAERFVEGPSGQQVRLVVLNGVGTPGIGEEVARILVPEGFRLVSSGNANTFGLKETQIVASSQDDLPAAQRARELLGVGEILLGNQPAGLADVTVVVGQDFGGP